MGALRSDGGSQRIGIAGRIAHHDLGWEALDERRGLRRITGLACPFPNRQLHVILDNLSTHKKNEEWLEAHPNVKFHFTPTSASWLNQVEVWFSILQGQSLSGASFTSLKQFEQHIDAYIKAYNIKAEPFVWTKKKVRQRPFKGRRITQL